MGANPNYPSSSPQRSNSSSLEFHRPKNFQNNISTTQDKGHLRRKELNQSNSKRTRLDRIVPRIDRGRIQLNETVPSNRF